MPVDRDLIAEGRAIDAALTPGPWYACVNDVIGGRCIGTVDAPASQQLGTTVVDEVLRDADAEHIARMRNIFGALLGGLQAAHEAIDAMQTAHESQLTRSAKGRARAERKIEHLKLELRGLQPPPRYAAGRCLATTVDPTDDHGTCLWCELPDSHAGKHHVSIPQPGLPSMTVDWADPSVPEAPE